ncbi:DUF748 domain-containing protein [Desulfosarcina sp.]|uniref:DUF748 domain-containing protein n=1 Tax=Desulfosarcina sp. TaxID=2027861 RepID=UPI003970D865
MIKTVNWTPRRKKIAITLAAAVLVYILSGFVAAPFIVRHLLEKTVAAAIHRQVTVEQVRVNPFTLSLTLRHLDIREPGGAPFAKLDEAYANLQTASLFKWALVLKSVRLVNPSIELARTGEATFNFSDIGGGRETAAGAPTDGGGLALVVVDMNITGGRIGLDDRVAAVSHRIDDLNLGVADFSSRPADVDVDTRFNLSARINDAPFTLDGKAKPFSPGREARAEIGLQKCQVRHYLPYVPLPENLVVQSFTLQTNSEVDFRMLADGTPELVAAGQTELIDVRVGDGHGEPFFHHPDLKFDLLPSKVLSGQLRFGKVESDEPEYFLKRLPSGDLYLPFLAASAYRKAEEKAQADAGDFQPVVTIDALNLTRGIVHLTDLSNRAPFTTTITRLDLEVENFGLNSDRTAGYRLQINTEADESIAVSGTASLTPLEASGTIDASDVKVPRYYPYHADRFGFKTVDGRVSLMGSYRFRQENNRPLVSLTGVSLNVDALKVVAEADDAPLISFDQLRVGDATAELAQGEVTLGSFALSRAHLLCRREKDGTLNLIKAFRPRSQAGSPDDVGAAGEQTAPSEAPIPAALTVTLKSVSVSEGAVDVEDRVPGDPVRLRLADIALTAADLSTAPGSTGKAELSLHWEQDGQLQAAGEVSLAPLDLDMTVKMQQMDIRPFQPYLSDQTGLIVTQGYFNTQGRLVMKPGQAASPVVTFRGKAGLNRFAAIDRKNTDDFLKWEDLLLDKLEVDVEPTRLAVEQISLADFFARVIIDADGGVNIVSMFNQPDDAAATDAGKTDRAASAPEASQVQSSSPEKPTIRIARVNLSKGTVDFSDRLIEPNFNARFHDLSGQVSGLASMAEKRADVLLEGVWSNQAPVKITGQVNPLIENPYLDLNLNISDIELSPFSPYSGKYIGYIMEKGKLTFNVDYLMENKRLEGKNSIYINQLTLGDTVESPDAVNLPIKLAVALLKNREGNIELDLPVSGSLDDPEFKIGKVILTALKNLIVKIITSPFAALGALAGGGGEELSHIDFAAGDSRISPDNREKIDKLAKILFERPALKLDVQGTASLEGDGEALQAVVLENRLKTKKLQQMMKSGKSAVPLEEISLTEEERTALLASQFADDQVALPVDSSGKPVELTPETMERLLRENTVVTENDYRSLANDRAFNAKNQLLETGQVERERVFIVEPKLGAGDQQQAPAGTGRVVFSLK